MKYMNNKLKLFIKSNNFFITHFNLLLKCKQINKNLKFKKFLKIK